MAEEVTAGRPAALVFGFRSFSPDRSGGVRALDGLRMELLNPVASHHLLNPLPLFCP